MHHAKLYVYYYMKILNIIFTCILVCITQGCFFMTFPIEEPITISRMPEYWAGAETFYLTSMNNAVKSERTVLPGTHVTVLQNPGSYMAITLSAQFQTGKTLPIGTLLPWLKTENGILLDREGGFCALLAELLWKQGYNIGNFNWKRLYALLKTVRSSIWNLNQQELARAIIENRFRSDMVTKKHATFTLSLPAFTETFYPRDPFSPVIHGGEQEIISLSAGEHIWFSKNSLLIITVDIKGRYTIYY